LLLPYKFRFCKIISNVFFLVKSGSQKLKKTLTPVMPPNGDVDFFLQRMNLKMKKTAVFAY